MPFQSEKQKKWMWANKPEMAREWTSKYGSKIEAKRGTMAKKDKNWIQKATKNMRKDKPCTGKKFGGPTCPKGTRRYNLAKTFRKMNKAATGTMVKADTGTWIKKKKWWENPKKLKSLTDNLKADMQFISDAQAGKLSPALAEKAKKKVLKKSSAGQGSGYADEIRKIIKRKPSIVGDEAKGTGPTYRPGYKPQLSVRTAKRGIFNTGKKGMPPATKYKKYLKSLKKMQTTPLSGMSTTLPPKTARLLSNLQFVYKDRGKSKKFASFIKKYNKTVGVFPYMKGKTKASTAMGKPSTFLQRKMMLGVGKPSAATSTFLKRRRQLSTAGAVGKTLLKRTGLGKAVLAATAVAGAYEAGKKNLLSKKKVQKKATGGEIIIGRGVDMDLL